jgi:hypothetical protein
MAACSQQAAELPADSLFALPLADLESDPLGVLAKLYDQLALPGYSADKEIPALAARLGTVRTREIVQPTGIEAARDYAGKVDEKKVWLWVALIAAVLVIVGMAFKLTRQMPAPGERPKPRVPGEQR